MRTERLLQVTSALCVAMGTILLGMGQRDMRMACLAIVCAMLSIWLTDILGLFRLNRWLASGIAIIASFIAFKRAIPINPISSMLAIAEMLVYLELVLLFQKKNHRVYWQLLVLSLLQVIVSALFSQGAQFGLMIIVFMFVALLDLTLLNLYSENLRAAGHLKGHGRFGLDKEIVDVLPPRVRVLVRRDLLRQVFRMGIATLFLTMLVFFMLPRFGRPAWRSSLFSEQTSVGFTDHIELGQLGNTVNDPTEVLRISFFDPKKPHREPITQEIYLHGTILTEYHKKHWSQSPRNPRRNLQRFFGRRSRHGSQEHLNYRRRGWFSFFEDLDLYRPRRFRQSEVDLEPKIDENLPNTLVQKITIEPMNRRELFGVRPYFVKEQTPEITYDAHSERLLRDESVTRKRFPYKLYTTGIFRKKQQHYYAPQQKVHVDSLLKYPDNIPTVINTATQWIEESRLPDNDPFAKAIYINERLSDPTAFSYSLNSRRTDFTIDPIEDFVKNNPEGHCEYFATTLAMMLRSQGIPCRLVVGFKCDEYNSLGKFYRVRQLHAHTWVEAHFTAEEADLSNPDKNQLENGIWYRFDPTSVNTGPSSSVQKFLVPLAQIMNWFDTAWDDYVMEMDRTRQSTAVYQPMINWLKNVYQKITDPQWWSEVLKKTQTMLNPRNWNTEKWISWRGGLIGVAIMLTMLVVFRSIRWTYRTISRKVRKIRAEKERRRRIEVEFYRRFLHVAARWGLTRSRGETPREFASLAGSQIAKNTKSLELVHLPSLITEAYYQVRFSTSPLDKTQQEKIELAVSQLEAASSKS